MRFAEIFLRLGCALVGWMVLLGYLLWLAIAAKTGCGTGNDELFRLLLVIAVPAVALSGMIAASRPLADVHGILRNGALLVLLLVPFVGQSVWRAAFDSACENPYGLLWPAVQAACVLAALLIVWLFAWRRPRNDAS